MLLLLLVRVEKVTTDPLLRVGLPIEQDCTLSLSWPESLVPLSQAAGQLASMFLMGEVSLSLLFCWTRIAITGDDVLLPCEGSDTVMLKGVDDVPIGEIWT